MQPVDATQAHRPAREAAVSPALALGYDATMAGSKLKLACALSPLLGACALERTWADIEALSMTDPSTSESETETETPTTATETETETSEGPSTGDPTTESTSVDPTTEPTDATTDPSTDTTETVTTEPDPVCGDGKVEGDEECDDGNQNNDDACLNGCLNPYCGDGFLAADEECDDGNQIDDDGCNAMCYRDRLVFVSSELRQGDFGSVSGANAICRALASDAGLPHFDTYRAWLADSDESPDSKFLKSWGRYLRVDGVPIAADYWDLLDGELDAPINVDEQGNELEIGTLVWTNTSVDGVAHPDSQHCLDWSTNDFFTSGRRGVTIFSDSEWVDAMMNNPAPCAIEGRFYCFEN